MTTLQNTVGTHIASPTAAADSALGALGRGLMAGVRKIQYGRMLSILHQLDDGQLARLEVVRDGIEAHARTVVYGESR